MKNLRAKLKMLSWNGLGRRCAAWCLGIVAVCLMAAQDQPATPPAEPKQADSPVPTEAYLIRVPLPLVDREDTQVIAAVDQLLAQMPPAGTRPILVLEFATADGRKSAGTRFERALALARFLAGDRLNRVRTVAYLPQDITGHAVLPVLACEEIIMAPDAQLGAAGQEEQTIDNMVREAYREIASRRRTIPVPVVLGMLDPNVSVTEVQLVDGGARYVLADELEAIRQESEVWKEGTIVQPGDLGLFTGRELRLEFGFVSHLANNRRELEEALEVLPGTLEDQVVKGESWRGLQIDVTGRLVTRTANEFVRAVQASQTGQPVNLICVPVDSPGGEPAAALQIVNALADAGPDVRTVAFVESEARSVAALILLACNEAYAAEDCQLGGPGITALSAADRADLRSVLQDLAQQQGADWSVWQALVDPSVAVFRYRHEETGQLRYLCEEERASLADAAKWIREGRLETEQGISGLLAQQVGLVRANVDSLPAVLDELNIDGELAVARSNQAITAIERLAGQPWFARTLLFVAFFALITEASAPGMGVAGFVSSLCFLLFFWSQFLNGTAGWLEVVLFLGGLTCIAIEILIIPGFGVFGIGGGIMVLASIVLASQTFVIPQNSYQFDQLPNSLMPIVFAGGGMMTALWIMRRMLKESPLFRLLTLAPPDEEELEQLESIVDWSYLSGKRGTAVTQLTPSGKARFGDDIIDVVSDGSVVPRGDAVVVTEVRGNHVLVEPVGEG